MRFTFTPLDKIGVKITRYELEYREIDSTSLSSLDRTENIHIDVIPQGTLVDSTGRESPPVTWEIDLVPPDVEAHLRSNRIPAVLVSIAFSGTDGADHAVCYRGGACRFNVLEGLPSGMSLQFYCILEENCLSCPPGNSRSKVNVGCVLNATNPGVITKVAFSINGRSVGVDTAPPFVSNTISMSPDDPVSGVASVIDTNGRVTTMNITAKTVSEACSGSARVSPSPSPSPECHYAAFRKSAVFHYPWCT